MAKGKKKNKQKKASPQVKTNPQQTKKVATVEEKIAKNKETPKVATVKNRVETITLLQKENLKWIGIGLAILIIGYLVMLGGRGDDPNVFDDKKMYSFMRITLGPILICLGFGVQMYGILKGSPKTSEGQI